MKKKEGIYHENTNKLRIIFNSNSNENISIYCSLYWLLNRNLLQNSRQHKKENVKI